MRTGVVVIAAAVAVHCGPRTAPPGAEWTYDHAGPAAAEGELADLSADEAAARLSQATEPVDIVLLANRLTAAGGTVADRERVIDAVDGLRADQLAAVWDKLDPSHFPAALVAFRRALVADHTGDPAAARSWLGRAEGAPEVAARATALAARLRASANVRPARVAVLLPLSGAHAALGRELRAAIVVAAAAYKDADLEFIDTGGDADKAVAAVDRAVHELGAVAILGPVGARESAAAAARAAYARHRLDLPG